MEVSTIDNSDDYSSKLPEEPITNLRWQDFLVIAIYFAFVMAVGIWSSYRSKKGSVSGYFLASRNMHWIPVGASLFASNIGSGHFIGLAGSGAASGIGIAAFELNAVFVLCLLGWLFVPVYMAAGVYTMPEYLRLRFGGQRIRIYLAVLALLLYVFTKISADLYAGALFIKLAMNLEGDGGLYGSILVLLAIAGLFTIAGGLNAVIWTDLIQTILMVLGAFTLMAISIAEVGGYEPLLRKYMEVRPHHALFDVATNRSCGAPPKDSLHMLRSAVPGASDMPWTGATIGLTISATWYWCSDQVIVQRALASRSMLHAKAGCILAGALKFLPLFLLVLPGMAARVLFTERVACANPEICTRVCNSPSGCTNIAYAELVLKLMPVGLSGLMLAVMMAALMSSLTSIFNSSSTIFTLDVWTRMRPQATASELLIVGKLSILGLLGVSVLWVPVILRLPSGQLFIYIQQVSNFLAPPVAAIYLLALLWPRTTEPGAFWGLMSGLVIGLIRFGLEFGYPGPLCGEVETNPRPAFILTTVTDLHYLHFSIMLFLLAGLISITVSLLTEPIPIQCLHRLTFWSRHSGEIRQPLPCDMITENEKSNGINEKAIMENEEEEHITQNINPWKKRLMSLCGVPTKEEEESQRIEEENMKKTPEKEAEDSAKFLYEDPVWKRFVNVCAVGIMSLAVFTFAFYT